MRIPYGDNRLYHLPEGSDDKARVMLSDILPTGFEIGVLSGNVFPRSTIAIVRAGLVGLAALLTTQFYSPAEIIMIDLDDSRLNVAKEFGATHCINSSDGKAIENKGVDIVMEAVGIPATFDLCQNILSPEGTN